VRSVEVCCDRSAAATTWAGPVRMQASGAEPSGPRRSSVATRLPLSADTRKASAMRREVRRGANLPPVSPPGRQEPVFRIERGRPAVPGTSSARPCPDRSGNRGRLSDSCGHQAAARGRSAQSGTRSPSPRAVRSEAPRRERTVQALRNLAGPASPTVPAGSGQGQWPGAGLGRAELPLAARGNAILVTVQPSGRQQAEPRLAGRVSASACRAGARPPVEAREMRESEARPRGRDRSPGAEAVPADRRAEAPRLEPRSRRCAKGRKPRADQRVQPASRPNEPQQGPTAATRSSARRPRGPGGLARRPRRRPAAKVRHA